MAGAQAAWGIDVGVSSLKALKLRRDGDRVIVEAFEVLEHDKFLSEPDVDRDALIRATLQKFMNKYAIRRDIVFIGVPGSSTFARFVKLPPVETKKIPEIVRFEAIQQIPFPLEQVNWDYHTFQHPDSPDVEVGIFAMKKELVAQIMSNFRSVDMNVQGVQMSPLAVYNAAFYDGMTNDKGTVVIDMGAEHTDIVIMDQGRVWLRSIGIGGNHFTDALAKSFKQQFSKAEKLKKEAATSKYQKQIYQAMRPIFADLVAEIQRSLGAYNSSHRDSRLERIVGMGNPFKLPNLQKYLQQELKMEVVRLETFHNASIEKAAAFSENILSMAAAYGLALQALGLTTIDTNLLPTEIARAMMWKKKQPWFIGAAAVLALGSVSIAAQWWMGSADFHSSSVEQQHATNVAAEVKNTELVTAWKGVNDNYDQAVKVVQDQTVLVSMRRIWPGVLADVFGALRPTIVITDMSSEYSATLSTFTPAASGAAPAAAPVTTVTPGATDAAAATASIGPSDHGFLVTISGYSRDGKYETVAQFLASILKISPVPAATQPNATQPAAALAKPYYYESNKLGYGGHPIQKVNTGPAGGGFGGGFTPVPVTPGGTQSGEKPWGNNRGPYWELFFSDLTGFKPPQTQPINGMPVQDLSPGSFDVPYPIDLVATRLSKPLSPQPMAGSYTFTLRFKVHITDDIK